MLRYGWLRRAVRAEIGPCCSATLYTHDALGELWWDNEDAEHIRTRSVRYPRADDIEPSWTLEAADDRHRIVRDPDPDPDPDPNPKSWAGYMRVIGLSPAAGFVMTVIVDSEDWSGVSACKTRGADVRVPRPQGGPW